MTKDITMRHLVGLLAAMLAAVALAIWRFDDGQVAAALAGARLSIGIGVLVAYAPVMLSLRLSSPVSTGVVLSVGIMAGWLAHIIFAGYTLGRQMDLFPANPAAVAVASTFADFAGILHLAAARAIEGRIPLRGWVTAGVAAALGAAISVTVIVAAIGVH